MCVTFALFVLEFDFDAFDMLNLVRSDTLYFSS
jgi:hypothetical protein